MKITFLIFLYLTSITVLSNEGLRVESNRKFEVVKFKKFTEIYMSQPHSKKKIKVFSQVMRDDVLWIYAPKTSDKIILATRPMIAGAEPSNFWTIENGKTRHLGSTKCADNEIKSISLKQIDYLCLSVDPKNPMEYLEESVRLKIQ